MLSEKFELKPNTIDYQLETYGTYVRDNITSCELRNWVKLFTEQELDKCPLFKKVYGKNFTYNRLLEFDNIYVQEETPEINGYQERNNVTLCIQEKDKEEDYFKKIKNNNKIKQILLHEMIHFLLRRGENDTGMKNTIKKKIKNGNKKDNFTEQECEIGRGLNEGLTEWITEKCGHSTAGSGYHNLINIIKELEIALGTKAIMKLGKGKNIHKILKMKKQECYKFLEKSDRIYTLITAINKLNIVLRELKKEGGIEDSDNVNIIMEFKNSYEYANYLKANNLEYTDENFIMYCEQMKKLLDNEHDELLADIDNTILNKYFKRDIDNANKTGKFTGKTKSLYKLIKNNNSSYDLKSKKNRDKLMTIPVRNRIEIIKSIWLKYYGENFQCNDILEGYDKIAEFGKDEVEEFTNFINAFLKEPKEKAILEFLTFCNEKEEYKNFNSATITQLVPTEQNKPIDSTNVFYNIDGKDVSNHHLKKIREMTRQNGGSAEELFLEYTLKYEEDYRKIVHEFDDIFTFDLLRNPDVKVKILNRVIVVEKGEEKLYYIIDNGIIPAKIESKTELSRENKKDKGKKVRKFRNLFKKRSKALPEHTDIKGNNINAREEWRKAQHISNFSTENRGETTYLKNDGQAKNEENDMGDFDEPE